MSMTKKDYVAIAGVLNQMMWKHGNDPLTITNVVIALGGAFETSNPNFQRITFNNACLSDPKGHENV